MDAKKLKIEVVTLAICELSPKTICRLCMVFNDSAIIKRDLVSFDIAFCIEFGKLSFICILYGKFTICYSCSYSTYNYIIKADLTMGDIQNVNRKIRVYK